MPCSDTVGRTGVAGFATVFARGEWARDTTRRPVRVETDITVQHASG